jgi:hypothetical protein
MISFIRKKSFAIMRVNAGLIETARSFLLLSKWVGVAWRGGGGLEGRGG